MASADRTNLDALEARMVTQFPKLSAWLLAGLSVIAFAATGGTPEVGSEAPAFRLQDQDGKWHALEDYRGKWVALYFYPKDATPGCTTQACELRANVFAFRKVDAVILGVSADDVEGPKKFYDNAT